MQVLQEWCLAVPWVLQGNSERDEEVFVVVVGGGTHVWLFVLWWLLCWLLCWLLFCFVGGTHVWLFMCWFVIFGSLVVFRGHDFTATEKDTPWMEEKCFKETTPTVNLQGWDEGGVKTENRTKAPGEMVNPTVKAKCTTEIPARYSILGRW